MMISSQTLNLDIYDDSFDDVTLDISSSLFKSAFIVVNDLLISMISSIVIVSILVSAFCFFIRMRTAIEQSRVFSASISRMRVSEQEDFLLILGSARDQSQSEK